MSIFKYLTISHLQKVLAALDVRFLGINNEINSKANSSDVLTKTNTAFYTPSNNYHPATKKYVDDVSQPKDLIVTIDDEYDWDTGNTTYSTDKTFTEVLNAMNNDVSVYFVEAGSPNFYSKRAYKYDDNVIYVEWNWGHHTYVFTSSGVYAFPDEIAMLHPDVYTFIGGDESEVYGDSQLYGQATSAHNKGDLLWVKHDVANTINLYVAKENIAVGDQFGADSVHGNLRQITIEDYIKDNGNFIVTITSTTVNDVTTYSADKTFTEITEAYESGKNCIVREQSNIYVLSLMASTGCCFTNAYANNNFNRSAYKTISISNSNVVTVYNKPFLTTDGTHNVYSNKKLIASVNGNFNTTPTTGSLTYSTTAYKAYDKDDLFWKDNTTLAKATTNIASGNTLTENTNYVSTTISDELKDIRSTHLSKTNTTAYTPTADYHPATKKYVDDAVSAGGTQSDWNENDTTSSSYIQNRTHYKTSLGYDLHLNLFPYIFSLDDIYQETFTVGNETISAYAISYFYFNNSDIYDESYFPTNTIDDFDLSLSSSILVVDGVSQTLNHIISRNNSYFATDVIFAYNNEYVVVITNSSIIVFHSTNSVPTSSLTYDLKLSNEIFEYNTLDNRYLNGELIIKGPGIKSEIFNGLTYEYGFPSKEILGNYSHIEGEASGSIFTDIYLSGQAGSTTYSLQYFNFDRYGDVIFNKELYAYEDNIEVPQPTGIYITSYSSSDGTITLSSTLNADSDISDYNYYLPLPLMYAGSDGHAEGKNTYASGYVSHAEGYETVASGQSSHAEGNLTIASGNNSHTEGQNTTASSNCSHAEGSSTVASNSCSHAEGNQTTSSGYSAHSEGCYTTASGSYSHAEGYSTKASGDYSHAEGYYTTAQRRSQHVFGEYNILDTGGSSTYTKGTYIEIVGKGTSSSARSNARTLDWSGNEVLAGKLTVGVAPTNDMDVATKKYVDDNAGGGGSSTLVDLTDTTISSPTNGQVLMYNSTSGKWENTTLPIYNGGVSS